MDPSFPLTSLTLAATSVADDVGFVALADLATALHRANQTIESRIIGGHMVMILVHRWGLGKELYRETQDADLGISLAAAKDDAVVDALRELGYDREAGNRYVRPLKDVPLTLTDFEPQVVAAVDILTPAYTSRPKENRKVSEGLTTTEVPGLAGALTRPGVSMGLELVRLNGEALKVDVVVPDEVSALVLKAHAWRRRLADKDAIDVWRTLEVALAAGLRRGDFGNSWGNADRILREDFEGRDGAAMNAIARHGKLSEEASRRRHTRIRAILERLIQ